MNTPCNSSALIFSLIFLQCIPSLTICPSIMATCSPAAISNLSPSPSLTTWAGCVATGRVQQHKHSLNPTNYDSYLSLSHKPSLSLPPSFSLSESSNSPLHVSYSLQNPSNRQTASLDQTVRASDDPGRRATSDGPRPSEQKHVGHATRSTLPDFSNAVYIPINEWKMQKLEDIQKKVKQLKHTSDGFKANSEASIQAQLAWTEQICLPLFRVSNYFNRKAAKCQITKALNAIPEAIKNQYQEGKLSAPENNYGSTALPSSEGGHRVPYVNNLPEPDRLDRYESPGNFGVHNNMNADGHQNGDESPSHGSRRIGSLDLRNVGSQEQDNESPSTDEVLGWEAGSLSTALALRKVSDLMKSIKDVSYTLGGSPSGSIYNSLRLSNRRKWRGSIDEAPSANVAGNKSIHSNQSLFFPGNQSVEENVSVKNLGNDRELDSKSFSTSESLETKEKSFDFASADAGARVLACSKGTVGAKNVLDGNVDKYLLTPCVVSETADTRWIDIELSEEMILERFQTGNFEYYSSSPRRLVILGAGSYPPLQWNLLGMFEFADVKLLQMFNIEKRLVSRYLRIMFSGRQGREYFCPVSVIRAFGKNLIADWKDTFDQKSPFSFSTGQTWRPSEQNPSGVHQNPLPKKVRMRKTEDHDEYVMNIDGADSDRREITPKDRSLSFSVDEIDSQKTCPVKRFANDLKKISNDPPETEDTLATSRRRDAMRGTPQKGSSKNGHETPSSKVHEKNKRQNQDLSKIDDIDKLSEDDRVVLDAVHANSFDLASDDGNIFRKVTRILRTLELNQTLTNQYIDTQLSKFARVVQALTEKEDGTRRRQRAMFNTLNEQFDKLKTEVEELQQQNWRRDVLLATLIATTGFVIGGLLILWTTMNGERGQMVAERLVGGSVGVSNGIDVLDFPCGLNDKVISTKDSRWQHEKCPSVEEIETSASNDVINSDGRSVSTTDLVTLFGKGQRLEIVNEWKERNG